MTGRLGSYVSTLQRIPCVCQRYNFFPTPSLGTFTYVKNFLLVTLVWILATPTYGFGQFIGLSQITH